MTGKTHRAGGMLISIVGFALLKENGLLLNDVNPALQWLVIYPFCMWGSTASDLDHHWESCPSKDYPSRVVNMVLHAGKPLQDVLDKRLTAKQKKGNPIYKLSSLLNASHRSWQTHSDLTLFAMLYLMYCILSGKFSQLSAVDMSISILVLTGICLGVIAHFILDVLTPEGVWCIGLVALNKVFNFISPDLTLPQKIHFVPKFKFFATGGSWEEFVRWTLNIATWLAVAWFLINMFLPYVVDVLPVTISIGGN